MSYVAIADRDREEAMHHPKSWLTTYIWSQDHKVIAIQYACTAIFVGVVALILSGMMRLQLGFPDTFHFITPDNYLQFITMHGMIMVIYLLTALFLGGFGNYLIPLMCGARDMVWVKPIRARRGWQAYGDAWKRTLPRRVKERLWRADLAQAKARQQQLMDTAPIRPP